MTRGERDVGSAVELFAMVTRIVDAGWWFESGATLNGLSHGYDMGLGTMSGL